tara:strand:+ start:2619 stop:4181 length:1563 start_codon:yes stop_codon:yes gene_type:complete
MNKNLQEIDKLFKNKKYNQVIKKTKKLVNSKEVIPPFYNLLGLSLAKIGKEQESELCFIEGIKKFPNEISLKSNISLIQLDLKKFSQAEKNINEALRINQEDIYTIYALANLNRDQFKFSEAINNFKKVCEINVKFPKALMYLGQSYLDLAQEKNDKNLYNLAEKNLFLSSELFPENTPVDYTLSTIINYADNNLHQKKMLNKIDTLKMSDEQKYFIFFALGKSFEDQKKFEQSFQFIKLANESKNRLIDKDVIKAELLRCRNVKKIFDNIHLKPSNLDPLFQKKIIFVIGLPRSGTTLVHQILSSDTESFGFGESTIFSKFFENNIFNKSFLSKILERKTMDEHIKKISNEIGNKYESISNKKIFVDKMPSNFYWVGFIKLLFPNSKIIHISRNIKDNCLSIYKNMFGSSDMDWSYSEQNIFKFVMNYRDIMKYWIGKYKEDIYEIRYENLVQNKVEETKKLFGFCEMKWDEKIFDFYKNAKTIRTVSVNQVKKPIYSSSIDSSSNYINYFQHLNKLED